jgi:hypothetical protein
MAPSRPAAIRRRADGCGALVGCMMKTVYTPWFVWATICQVKKVTPLV